MKRFMLFMLFFSLKTSILAEQEQPTKQVLKKPKQEEKDTGPIIIGTILHSIVPNLLNAMAAKEMDDTEEIIHSVGGAVQGIGALILALSKAVKKSPNLTAEKCLFAYLRSVEGKKFLHKYRSRL